jgi:hypothetical protein
MLYDPSRVLLFVLGIETAFQTHAGSGAVVATNGRNEIRYWM